MEAEAVCTVKIKYGVYDQKYAGGGIRQERTLGG